MFEHQTLSGLRNHHNRLLSDETFLRAAREK